MIVLAVDVGGTNLRAALIERGTVLHRTWTATRPGSADRQAIDLVSRLLRAHPGLPPAAVGIGVPEYVRAGEVTSNEVVTWAPDTASRIAGTVEDATGATVSVVVEADVRCGAVAEHARLARPDELSLLYVSWGTGISSALVLPGGTAWSGARGEALALGEWRDPAGRRLEELASGGGIERGWQLVCGSMADAVAIHARAVAGDQRATALFDAAGRALGRALHQMVAVLDPHVVVLGGGLGTAEHLGRTALFAELARLPARAGFPPVLPARTGDDAGLLGAAVLAGRAAPPA
ncbi:MAG: ROK family protein [Propionicimonas sp.]|nr:ROK family protein [Propionicimonas sp.]